jgi:hypothetical protein
VALASWLIGFSAAILGYFLTQLIAPDAFVLKEPLRAVAVSILGIGVSIVAGYLSLLYGGYANRNWEKADQIADNRGWKDLLPSDQPTYGSGLNLIAKGLARSCDPKHELPRVFVIFFGIAVFSFALHLALLVWSLKML